VRDSSSDSSSWSIPEAVFTTTLTADPLPIVVSITSIRVSPVEVVVRTTVPRTPAERSDALMVNMEVSCIGLRILAQSPPFSSTTSFIEASTSLELSSIRTNELSANMISIFEPLSVVSVSPLWSIKSFWTKDSPP